MIVIAVAASMMSVWLGAWFAGLDMSQTRDYFSLALVAVLMPIWRLPLAMIVLRFENALDRPLVVVAFHIVWWGLWFVLLTLMAGKSLGGSFKQSAIVALTVIIISLVVPWIMGFLFG